MDEKEINGYPFVHYSGLSITTEESVEQSNSYYQLMDQRRSVRDFSDRPVPKKIIENILLTASTAPSGAHKQPWTFCVVSDPDIKAKIRAAAEQEELESYSNRMSEEWLDDLKPMQTDWHKPFLEIAPYLIIVFKKAYELDENGEKHTNYYVNESVGLACGFMLTAIHKAGLVALTHTPSPMNFLTKILDRPANERPFLLIPVGYPSEEAYVPKLDRRPLSEIAKFYK